MNASRPARRRLRIENEAAACGLLFLMVLPNLVWIVLDRGKWVSDTSLYALNATRLHHALLNDTAHWWAEMLAVSPKPPVLPWVGQFFIAVGRLIGNIDIGLLLVVFAAHYGGLWLLYQTLMKTLQERSMALVGCLALASAPMFVLLSTQFYVQPVQLFAVSWFLWIMVSSKNWDALLTLLHLGAASSVAVLATMSSPAYCVIPGSIALSRAWTNRATRIHVRGAHVGIALVAVVAAALAAAWYLRNFDEAAAYGRFGYSFDYAAEVKDVFLIKLAEWGRLLLYGFFLSALITLLFPWALANRARKGSRRWEGEAAVMALLIVQIALVFLMLASSAHQTFRYLLPLAPYFALVGIWSLSELDRKWLRRATVLVFVLQLAITNLGLYLWGDQYLARERRTYVAALDAVTRAIAEEPRDTVWLGIGELGVYNFDLAYHASKSPDYHPDNAANYDSIEISLTSTEIDGDVESLWKRIESARGLYIVLQRQPPPLRERDPDDVWQKVILGTREISARVRRSANFERMATPDSWEVEIYRDAGGGESPKPVSTGVR